MLRTRPVWLAIAAFFAFALMPIFTRGAQAHILAIAAWRAILVAGVFGLWTLAREGGPKALLPDKTTLRLGSFYGLALALASSTFVGGYAFTTVANTIFLHNLAPIMAFPLAWWMYRERLSATATTGAVISVFGVGLLSGVSLFQVSNYASSRFLLGDFLSLVSALGYALVLVLTRYVRQKETPLLGTLWVAWCVAAVVLSIVAGAFGTMAISWSAILWVLGLAIICTNIPFYLLNLSMRHVPAGLASVLSLSEVVFATGVGILVYEESLAPMGWLGATLVIVGLMYPLTTSEEESNATEESIEAQPIGPNTMTRRGYRLGLGLLLFNSGAAVLFMTGNGSGAILSWAGLCVLIRLGFRPASQLLNGRFDRALHWIAGASALAIGLGLILNREWLDSSSSVLVIITAVGALILDERWMRMEDAEDREAQPLLRLALGALVLAQVFSLVLHPASRWFVTIAVVAIALQAWTVLLAALRGRLGVQALSAAPGVARLEQIGVMSSRGRFAIPVLLVAYLAGGLHIVPAGHQGIIERLGEPLPGAQDAGLMIQLPPPIDAVRIVDVEGSRQVVLIEEGSALLCQDETMVSLEMNLHYKVSDAHDFAFGAVEPDAVITMLGRSALIEAVAARTQDQVLVTALNEIEEQVARTTQENADSSGLGILVESVQLTRSAVPIPVLSAFLDVASAKADEETSFKEAKAYEFDLLPRTSGRAETLLAQAQIDQILDTTRAQISLDEFTALHRGIAENRPLSMLRIRYEHLESALSRSNLIISPESIHLWLDSSTPLQPRTLSGEEGP